MHEQIEIGEDPKAEISVCKVCHRRTLVGNYVDAILLEPANQRNQSASQDHISPGVAGVLLRQFLEYPVRCKPGGNPVKASAEQRRHSMRCTEVDQVPPVDRLLQQRRGACKRVRVECRAREADKKRCFAPKTFDIHESRRICRWHPLPDLQGTHRRGRPGQP